MPTLRELTIRAKELEERGLVLQWMDTQLRTLITGGTELRVADKPVQTSTVANLMADLKELLELNSRELESILNQELGPAAPQKEEDPNGIPEIPQEKPRRAQQGRKG